MKKGILRITLFSVFFIIIAAFGVAMGAQEGSINVYIDGRSVDFDVKPQVIGNRTMVPIRAVFEEIGASVEWDGETKTALCTKDGISVKMTVDSTTMYIDNNPVYMDVSPVVIEGRTLAPARYAAEAYGANVCWSETKKNVVICSNGVFAYADYPDIPDLGKCYGITSYKTEYKDGFMFYTYVYSNWENDDYYSALYDNSASVLGNYKEEAQGKDADGVVKITYTKPSEEAPRYWIFASENESGDMIFTVVVPDKKETEKVIMYATDGRTAEILPEEIEAYKNAGWYSSPDDFPRVTLYAKDGRTVDVLPEEVEAYLKVSWYRTAEEAAPVTLYSADGKTVSVSNAEVPDYLAVGWFITAPKPPKQQSEGKSGYTGKVYRTPSGKKYHFSSSCGGKNSYEITLEQARRAGLTPCSKCTQ